MTFLMLTTNLYIYICFLFPESFNKIIIMKLLRKAQAGTFESSDIIILVEPVPEKTGRKLEISSSVMLQYGEMLTNLINIILDKYKIKDIHLVAKDKGALEPTIIARLETAIERSLNQQKGTLA